MNPNMNILKAIRREQLRKKNKKRFAAERARMRQGAAARKKEDSQTRCDGCGCPLGDGWIYCVNCGKKIIRK